MNTLTADGRAKGQPHRDARRRWPRRRADRSLSAVADDGPVLPGVNAEVPPAEHVRVFGSRAFFRLWLAQVVSALGDWIGFVAIVALAQAIGGSSPEAAIALVMSARLDPGLLPRPVRGRARRPVGPQEGHGRAATSVAALVLATLPFIDTVWGLVVASLLLEIGDAAVVAGQGGVGPEPRAARSPRHRELAVARGGVRHVPDRQLRCSRSSPWSRAAWPSVAAASASSTSTSEIARHRTSTSARSSCRP